MKTALLAAAAALATLATPALAEGVSVSYKDLDLSTAAGKDKLARRLDSAAREACGYGAGRTGTRMVSREATQCYKDAQQRSQDTMAAILDGARLGG